MTHGSESPGDGGGGVGRPLDVCKQFPQMLGCPGTTPPVGDEVPFAAIWGRYLELEIEPTAAEWMDFARLSRQAGMLEESCFMAELAESQAGGSGEAIQCLQLQATILTELDKPADAIQILERIQQLQGT